MPVLRVSAKTGQGLLEWIDCLQYLSESRKSLLSGDCSA
jgi:hypothetical protein